MNKQITRQNVKQGQNGKSGSNQNLSPNKRVTRQSQKIARRQEEQQRREAEQRRAKQRRRFAVIGLIAVIVLAVGLTAYFIASAHSQNGQNAALAQETPVNPSYPAIDGINCDQLEQTAYHVHAHVSIYIKGQLSLVPSQTGIAPDGSCFYWLHTHNTDGIIHIEAPAKTTPTLGNFLDIWDSKFSTLGYPIQLADPSNWKVWIDGKPYTGNFRNIHLQAHELITLAYNSPNVTPDTTYNWGNL